MTLVEALAIGSSAVEGLTVATLEMGREAQARSRQAGTRRLPSSIPSHPTHAMSVAEIEARVRILLHLPPGFPLPYKWDWPAH